MSCCKADPCGVLALVLGLPAAAVAAASCACSSATCRLCFCRHRCTASIDELPTRLLAGQGLQQAASCAIFPPPLCSESQS